MGSTAWERPSSEPRFAVGSRRRGEQQNEHLDNIVCHSAGCMDLRLYGVSCGGRIDSLAAGLRGNFPDPAFCLGQKDGVTGTER